MTKQIHIVDDDMINAQLLGGRLEKHGFEISYNFTGENVLNEIKELNPTLIILDIVFPTVSGMDVLKEIRKAYSSIELPVIMVTSKQESKDVVNALDAGASDFITKPPHIKIALARINTHIEIRELNESLVKKSSQDTFAAMVATYNHEINNPLLVVFGKINLLKRGYDKKHVDDLEKASLRIKDIVRRIADLAEEGEVEFTPYSDDVNMIKFKKPSD